MGESWRKTLFANPPTQTTAAFALDPGPLMFLEGHDVSHDLAGIG